MSCGAGGTGLMRRLGNRKRRRCLGRAMDLRRVWVWTEILRMVWYGV